MAIITTTRLALMQAETACYKCRARVPVVGLAASPEAQVDDEQYSLVPQHGWLGLTEIEMLPDDILQLLRERAPGYRADDSATAGLRYLMNHCECGAKLGDFFLHSEPDGPFFGLDTEGLRAWLIERPLRVEASYSEGALDDWLRNSFAVWADAWVQACSGAAPCCVSRGLPGLRGAFRPLARVGYAGRNQNPCLAD